MAFIKPLLLPLATTTTTTRTTTSSTLSSLRRYNHGFPHKTIVRMSPHPLYDVASVSTYIAYFLAQYWTGEQRRDVEFFAIFMGMFWNFTHDHDATIFLMLWLIGGVSEFISKSFLAGGNEVEYANFRVGIKFGGYLSFLLLVFDALDLLTGY